MSGECDKCGEHCLECRCLDISISCDIQSRIAPIYEKYKDYPKELIDALEFFIEAIDEDRTARETYRREGGYMKSPEAFIDNILFNRWPFPQTVNEEPKKDKSSGYICRVCAVNKGAVPPKDHVCTWHRAKCHFCNEEANLCHTSDWNWPDKKELEGDREV